VECQARCNFLPFRSSMRPEHVRCHAPNNLPDGLSGDSFGAMSQRRRRENRVTMREGDRILINKGISKKVMIIARTAIPHSNERIFVTKSGGKYTIGLKVWRSDYAWNEKNQMWVPKR
jgi:hypothetical protein